MPVAHCYLSPTLNNQVDFAQLVKNWAEEIGVSEKDITLSVFDKFEQYGQSYKVLVNLYLPSLWSNEAVKHIQETCANLLIEELQLQEKDVFIITSIINSGHVFSQGKTEEWE